MSEILIRHCRLRLVRRGGWSWGPDPRALHQAAVQALPALLAAALEGLWPEEEERTVSTPVRLRLRVRASELIEACASLPEDGHPPAGSPAATLARRLAVALAGAVGEEASGHFESAVDEPAPARPSPPGPLSHPHSHSPGRGGTPALGRPAPSWGGTPSLPEDESTATINREGRRWRVRKGGDKAPDFSPSGTSESRLRRNHDGSRPDTRPGEGEPPSLASSFGAVAPLSRAGGVRVGEGKGVRVPAKPAPELPEHPTLAPPAEPGAESPAGHHHPPLSVPRAAPFARPPSPALRPIPWRDTDIHVASALPFLLLGALSRTGYLETLAATFTAAGLAGDLPLFAAALAYKVLPPPERGWRRTPEAMRAAAACAGLLDPVSDGDLSGLALRAAPCLEVLAADLAASLLAGHEPGRPLLLAAAGEGLLLVEADGVFPIAWAPTLSELFGCAVLPSPARGRGAGGEGLARSETLLVSADTATPALLRELDAIGIRFVTDASPSRGEPWRPLRRLQSGKRLWTNDPAAPGLARQAAGLAAAEDGARRLWQALAVERPSVPRAAGPAFDRHLTLAAGMALGTLAWTLWRDREPVDPVLALERFGDLDARVRFRARFVHVLLPLGRRHHDLFSHRLLEPVRDAAWLGGRVLEFGGG